MRKVPLFLVLSPALSMAVCAVVKPDITNAVFAVAVIVSLFSFKLLKPYEMEDYSDISKLLLVIIAIMFGLNLALCISHDIKIDPDDAFVFYSVSLFIACEAKRKEVK